jgi:hypothetical protein
MAAKTFCFFAFCAWIEDDAPAHATLF